MKRILFETVCIGTALVVAGCSDSGGQRSGEAPAEATGEIESRVQHGANGSVVITLDVATQKTMGLQTAPLTAAELAPEVKGFGHVVDPAPLAEMVMELGKAQLVFDNSHLELERMKVLKKENNASERAWQTAETAYRQNLADVGAITFKIQKNYGSRMTELLGPMVVPPGTPRNPNPLVEGLVEARGVFLVRVDLPGAEASTIAPSGARVVGLGLEALPVPADYFGEAPAVDPQTQAHGYFFLVTTNQPKLMPGMAVRAFIQTEGPTRTGVVLPRNAIVRFNGATWVYLQTSEKSFSRTEVALDRPFVNGWFVCSGLKAPEMVVTVGAQQLLSEELKGQIGE